MTDAAAPFFSANDLVRMLFGVLIVSGAVFSILLFLARFRRRDFSFLYFGLGAFLYGIRLFVNGSSRYMEHRWDIVDPVVSLLIIIPFFLFFVETVSPHWKRFTWLVIGPFIAIAVLGLSSLAVHRNIGLVRVTTHVVALVALPIFLVILFVPFRSTGRDQTILRTGLLIFLLFAVYDNLVNVRAIRGNAALEYIGFIFFLGCLGYVAVSRTLRNEERLLTLNKELEIARGIQAGLLPEKSFSVAGLNATSHYVPASSVAGDFYDFLPKDGGLGVLIADVSGHGVPAALSASIVKVAIKAQRDWADDPARVLTGLNSILCGNLQGQFVTAGYLYLDPNRGTLTYAGAGHPPLLVWRAKEARVESMEENGLMLGIFPEGAYKSLNATLNSGDRFILYTDGITEAPSASGEEFGMERLKDFLRQNSAHSTQELCDLLIRQVDAWCAGGAQEQHDDVTLIVVDYKAA